MEKATNKRLNLREGLKDSKPIVAVGAHDALSAQMIQKHGFDAIWVSGFGVSTMQFAIPDANLVTMTEALAAATRMDTVVDIPVVADCDNGFGGLANVVRTIHEYERAGVAGVCIEDNLFPKRNSLFNGKAKRDLIPMEEQAKRIKAAKAAQETEEFVFIARIESLIARHGIEDACRRADAYAEAGADAILIHSKDKTLQEIEGFLSQWQGGLPLVAVPSLFPTFTVEELHKKGFQMIILANQVMRAAIKAMEQTLSTLQQKRCASAVDEDIVPINYVFDLVKTAELYALEDK